MKRHLWLLAGLVVGLAVSWILDDAAHELAEAVLW